MRFKLMTGALVATIGFLLATNPVVADAAGQITGAQIKNDSIKGKDVKESSLKTVPRAATAGDSGKLAGQPPTTYLDRVSYRTNPALVELYAGVINQLVPTVSITVPAGVKYVHAIGTTSIQGNSNVGVWIQVDSLCTDSGNGFDNRIFSLPGASGEDAVTANYVAAVAPGTHTIRLCARHGATGGARGSTLSVETVAGGDAGSAPVRSTSYPR